MAIDADTDRLLEGLRSLRSALKSMSEVVVSPYSAKRRLGWFVALVDEVIERIAKE